MKQEARYRKGKGREGIKVKDKNMGVIKEKERDKNLDRKRVGESKIMSGSEK